MCEGASDKRQFADLNERPAGGLNSPSMGEVPEKKTILQKTHMSNLS